MKKLVIIMVITLGVFTLKAQEYKVVDTVDVAMNMSGFLIFDSEPEYIPGHELIIVSKEDNKIIVQADYDFDQVGMTNLLVLVEDQYFLFVIRYKEDVKQWFHNYQGIQWKSNQDQLEDSSATTNSQKKHSLVDASIARKREIEQQAKDSTASYFNLRCDTILKMHQDIKTLGVMKYKYLAYISNMYVDDNHFYIRYGLKNNSNVKFQIDYQSFTIKNKAGTFRKKAYQDLPVETIYVKDQIKVIEGKSLEEMVFVFDKFTIDKDKYFSIEVWESDGDRRITIDIDYKHLIDIEKLTL